MASVGLKLRTRSKIAVVLAMYRLRIENRQRRHLRIPESGTPSIDNDSQGDA
jgi:hypothetical protein